ncbi:MAG: hypothetical protein Sylvanvirus3_34 [Sylvanvirus sp.]|uniref:Uncharacterized protein n=1 Tax=Sylvanvirus sp. TaxID=2487774 RepID=A0A3G5AHE3_9VIRU|nr:MAG: hypothetical protein Sylvanvirus3_34 [Sylvanvirus sp.]
MIPFFYSSPIKSINDHAPFPSDYASYYQGMFGSNANKSLDNNFFVWRNNIGSIEKPLRLDALKQINLHTTLMLSETSRGKRYSFRVDNSGLLLTEGGFKHQWNTIGSTCMDENSYSSTHRLRFNSIQNWKCRTQVVKSGIAIDTGSIADVNIFKKGDIPSIELRGSVSRVGLFAKVLNQSVGLKVGDIPASSVIGMSIDMIPNRLSLSTLIMPQASIRLGFQYKSIDETKMIHSTIHSNSRTWTASARWAPCINKQLGIWCEGRGYKHPKIESLILGVRSNQSLAFLNSVIDKKSNSINLYGNIDLIGKEMQIGLDDSVFSVGFQVRPNATRSISVGINLED